MRRRVAVIVLIGMCAVVGEGQRSSRRAAPAPPSGSVDAAEKAFRQLRELEVLQTSDAKNPRQLEAYRKPSKQDLEVLKPAPAIVSKYSQFLREKNSGIIKLNAYEKCSTNGEVISADEDCLKYNIPGGGTSYSFRYETYRIPRLSDIILQNTVLKTDGVLQQGMMVDLGKVPIEDIGLTSPGFEYLVNFEPARKLSDLRITDQKFVSGVEANGFMYRLGFYARMDHTFGLRSIAFQRMSADGPSNSRFDEFQLDKRHDVIVVLKVVDVDYAGNVTVVWKELSRRDAPKLKFEQES